MNYHRHLTGLVNVLYDRAKRRSEYDDVGQQMFYGHILPEVSPCFIRAPQKHCLSYLNIPCVVLTHKPFTVHVSNEAWARF
jgi:hypothetical protein